MVLRSSDQTRPRTRLVAGCGGSGRQPATASGGPGAAPPAQASQQQQQQQQKSPPAATNATFRDHDLVISAVCTVPASRPAKVWVHGFEPGSWKTVVSVEFTLPAAVVVGSRQGVKLSAIQELCAGNRKNLPKAV
ncbi:hypothetical protein AB0D10_01565 [Kitasatospora sp. NPDC048545]|uniref:hypothetical protein n=1 Tax=Kitasatospora sp. NPDC048545 TaxID=3157208 RepID=UPI00340579EA